MQNYPIILGTAGHIDHGKTSLVKALTGIDTDRLKEEKERGITTELGFAHLDLKGRRFGLVDVPGHERFIKAMVAGAGGLDLVCLVIAADEGIMPQTREHLDICELLGVRLGTIVLSKADLVDEEWLELVASEIKEELVGSFLEDAEIIPVSVKTGQGLDDLRNTLMKLTDGLQTRTPDGRFRLPVDRIFSVKGFGTIVTGTVISGNAAVGDELICAPGGRTAKIRGLQIHGEEATKARAGMRCAMNVAGIGVDEITRGDVFVHEGSITPSHIIDINFRYLKSCKLPLKKRSRVLLHHGTTQRMAMLVMVDKEELLPGEEAIAQLRLDSTEPLVALPGDKVIVRGFVVQKHYGTTIGGGEVIRVQAPKTRSSAVEANELLNQMAHADQVEKMALEIKSAKTAGRDAAELAQRTGLSPQIMGSSLQRLVETGTIVRAGKGKLAVFMHGEQMARLEKQATDAVAVFHDSFPEKRGMPKAELVSKMPTVLPAKLFDLLLATLVGRKALEVDQDVLRRPGKGAADTSELSDLEAIIEGLYASWGNTPERTKNLPEVTGAPLKVVKTACHHLLTLKTLIKVSDDLYLHVDAITALKAGLLRHFEGESEMTPGQWKEIVGASRKFTIPLAEYFDRERITIRVENVRKLRSV